LRSKSLGIIFTSVSQGASVREDVWLVKKNQTFAGFGVSFKDDRAEQLLKLSARTQCTVRHDGAASERYCVSQVFAIYRFFLDEACTRVILLAQSHNNLTT
jgi:hypothetical protein